MIQLIYILGLLQLKQEVSASQTAAFAPSTLDNLRCQCKAYLLFCNAFNLQPFPASLQVVCLFTQFLSRSFNSVTSICNYVSGIKLIHLVSGLPFPHIDRLEYKLLVKGLKKLNPFIPRQALPITPHILLDIRKVLDLSDPTHATLWCAFILAFFLFARKSNIVPPSANTFHINKHLCRRDIIIGSDKILVYIKWSKTIQAGERYILIPFVHMPTSPLCPKAAVLNMFAKVQACPQDPAFLIP